LAELERSSGQHVKALEWLEQALKDDPSCIRGYILRARIEASVRDWRGVALAVDEIERRTPEFLPEVLDLAVHSCIRRGESEAVIQSYLRRLYETYGTEEAGVHLSDRIAGTDGIQAARLFLTSALRRRPSALLARKLFALLAEERQGFDSESLSLLMSPTLSSMTENGVRYICSQCGFLGTELHWKCPSCQCWNVMKPKR
jgi:lipopolysaccharide biosynthesis regulator YciM